MEAQQGTGATGPPTSRQSPILGGGTPGFLPCHWWPVPHPLQALVPCRTGLEVDKEEQRRGLRISRPSTSPLWASFLLYSVGVTVAPVSRDGSSGQAQHLTPVRVQEELMLLSLLLISASFSCSEGHPQILATPLPPACWACTVLWLQRCYANTCLQVTGPICFYRIYPLHQPDRQPEGGPRGSPSTWQ